MWILKEGKEIFMRQLKFAIENDQEGSSFVYELLRAWQGVPILLSNLSDKFIQGVKDNSDIIQLLSQSKGRTWLKNNIDSIIDYLLQISQC